MGAHLSQHSRLRRYLTAENDYHTSPAHVGQRPFRCHGCERLNVLFSGNVEAGVMSIALWSLASTSAGYKARCARQGRHQIPRFTAQRHRRQTPCPSIKRWNRSAGCWDCSHMNSPTPQNHGQNRPTGVLAGANEVEVLRFRVDNHLGGRWKFFGSHVFKSRDVLTICRRAIQAKPCGNPRTPLPPIP